jgi:hypothetical protein
VLTRLIGAKVFTPLTSLVGAGTGRDELQISSESQPVCELETDEFDPWEEATSTEKMEEVEEDAEEERDEA